MERRVTRSTYLAQLITRFTNPCILSVVTLLLIAYTKSSNVRELVGWVAIIFLFFVVMPTVCIYARTSRSGNRIRSVFELTIFLKQHPRDILILALLLGLPCLAIMLFLKAPAALLSSIVALITSSIVTALFNMFYRVSFHLTGITVLVVMAIQAWGLVFLVVSVTIPLTFWAKYYLREHTIPQLVMGMALAVIVSLASLYLFSRIEVLLAI